MVCLAQGSELLELSLFADCCAICMWPVHRAMPGSGLVSWKGPELWYKSYPKLRHGAFDNLLLVFLGKPTISFPSRTHSPAAMLGLGLAHLCGRPAMSYGCALQVLLHSCKH